jgi:TM2 domain-containing membrane protein YozV
MWSVGYKLYKQLNISSLFSNKTFKFFVTVPLVIIILILVFWLWGATILGLGQFSMANVLTGMLVFVIPLEILFMISKLYCFYFVAKVLKSAEKNETQTFETFAVDFIWLVLFPIGLWFIQPRVNKLAFDSEQ